MASTAAARYKKSKTEAAKAKKGMKQAAKAALKELAAEFFAAHPEILSFGWTQYTPYWNDGDTCVFSANAEYPTILFKTKDGKTVVYDAGSGEFGLPDFKVDGVTFAAEELDYSEYEKEITTHEKAVTKFLKNFDEDDLEGMFGDHVEVNINRKGKIEVGDYEHE